MVAPNNHLLHEEEQEVTDLKVWPLIPQTSLGFETDLRKVDSSRTCGCFSYRLETAPQLSSINNSSWCELHLAE